jgi:hypothetical protein
VGSGNWKSTLETMEELNAVVIVTTLSGVRLGILIDLLDKELQAFSVPC